MKLTWVKLTKVQEGDKHFAPSNVWSHFPDVIPLKVMKKLGNINMGTILLIFEEDGILKKWAKL